MKKTCIFSLLAFFCINMKAQDSAYANDFIKTFSSERFDGRGYVNSGVNRAAVYLDSIFHELHLTKFDSSYLQKFTIPINTQPGNLKCTIDSKGLLPAIDYMVGGASPASKGHCKYISMDTSELFSFVINKPQFIKNKFVVLPYHAFRNPKVFLADVAGFIFRSKNKLTWKVSDATQVINKPYFFILDTLIKEAGTIAWEIESIFYPAYNTENVAGYLPGKKYPDTLFVFTGHYDHLGRMGKDVFFPGANDNASGIAMLLDLARYYSKERNKSNYSIAFIAFSAEECGLFGSRYFAANSPFDLKKIKFLFNLDMVGSGSDGIGIVNGKDEPIADSLIKKINKENDLFPNIQSRKGSCNSDHCPFVEKGVAGVFIYTKGPEHTYYHVPEDKAKVPLTKWNELHYLLTKFVNEYPEFERSYNHQSN